MSLVKIRNAANTAWINVGGGIEVYQSDSEPTTTYAGMLWLDTDASGWIDMLQDEDGDTYVHTEESADEDYIRMYTGGTEKVRITPDGEFMALQQPYALVKLSTSWTKANTGYVTIPFDTEEFDIGDNFDTTTYLFTAPVDGRYLCAVNPVFVVAYNTEPYYIVNFNCNALSHYVWLDPTAYAADAAYHSWLNVAIVELDEGDTINCQLYHGTAADPILYGGYYTYVYYALLH